LAGAHNLNSAIVSSNLRSEDLLVAKLRPLDIYAGRSGPASFTEVVRKLGFENR
jgi:hypothetical protein